MQLFYHPTNPQSKCNWVMDALKEGWPRAYKADRDQYDPVKDAAIWGMIGDNANIAYRHAIGGLKSEVGRLYFWDMGYYNRYSRYNDGPWYWRVGRNTDFPMYSDGDKFRDMPDRFEKWGVEPKPFRDGEYILLLPSSEAMTKRMFGTDVKTWIKTATLTLSQFTDREFKIRYKPRANGTSGPDALQPGQPTLHDDLQKAHAVVTCTSMGAIEAVLEGVPAYGLGFMNLFKSTSVGMACMQIDDSFSLPSYSNIREYHELIRNKLLNTVAYHQYTLEEMRSGEAHELITKHL